MFLKEKVERQEEPDDRGDVEVVEVRWGETGEVLFRKEVRSFRREERGWRGWNIVDGILGA